MAEVSKGDLMFFQNEILTDIKKLESKINIKIDKQIEDLKQKIMNSEKTTKTLSDKYDELFALSHSFKDKNEEINKILQFYSKVEDITSRNTSKIEKFEKDIGNITFKYDKILNMNLTLPGIIGTEKCKFKNLRDFLDYANKSIHILMSHKDKQIFDFRGYKDKLDTTIKNFNLQIDHVINKYKEFCSNSIKFCENQFERRINETEDKVENLRIENNKNANDLLNECNNFRFQWQELENYKKKLENDYKINLKKQEELYNEFANKFDVNEKDYRLIKQKFTELSNFIKSVRFRKNIGEVVKIQDFRDMSSKVDFTKRQKLQDEYYDYYNMENIKIPEFLNEIDENDIQEMNNIEESKKNENNNNHKKINYQIITNNNPNQIKSYIINKGHKKNKLSQNLPSVNYNIGSEQNIKNNISFIEPNSNKFNHNTVESYKNINSRNKFLIPKNNSQSNFAQNSNNLIVQNSISNRNVFNSKKKDNSMPKIYQSVSPEGLKKIKMKNNSMDINIESNNNKTARDIINNISSKYKFKKIQVNNPINISHENSLYNSNNKGNELIKDNNIKNELKQINNSNNIIKEEKRNENLNDYYEHLQFVKGKK